MATDEALSEAIQSLFHDSQSNPNPNTAFTSLNGVVQHLESKLGLDLTHKVDFIRAQIHHHLLYQTQQPPPNDHFALQHSPNFLPSPSSVPSAFHTFSAQPPAPLKAEAVAVAGTELPKERAQSKPKRKGGPGGLNKLCGVSPLLQAIVGQPALPRTEIVKQLWAYIRKNNLQDPSNKRKIICNDELRLVFETDCTDMFKMNKLLAKHIIPLEPSKPSGSKKQKVDVESRPRITESGPSVIVSEALANFLGIGGREMLQSEVLSRIWEYIKVNNLENPLNPMVILCDSKLYKLFGCESISASTIPEALAIHHIIRR